MTGLGEAKERAGEGCSFPFVKESCKGLDF